MSLIAQAAYLFLTRVVTMYTFFTHHCSEDAIDNELDDLDLTADFEVPSEMTRRVHFWVKVFSHYTSNEYILHSTEYPELIFDIASISKSAKGREYRKLKRSVEVQFREKTKEYEKVLAELHSDPSNVNSHLKKKIVRELAHIDDANKYQKAGERFRIQKGQADSMRKGLTEFSAYAPHIFDEFRKQNVPTELSYLTFVESTFNKKAVSKVGASGVYQIMPRTGRPYLKINRKFDERRDPIKSAMAAAKILKTNYKVTKENWPLAITGYNHGAYGMRRASEKHKTDELWQLIMQYQGKTFGFASKNFYAEFLAINYIIDNQKQLFSDLKTKPLLQVHSITNRRKQSVRTILKKYKMTLSEFVALNPDINKRYRSKRTLLPIGYTFKVNKDRYKAWMTDKSLWENKKEEKLSQILNDDDIMVSN